MANDPFTENMRARRRVLSEGVPIRQKVGYWSNTKDGAYTAGQALVLNHPLRNVGIITKIWLECEFTLNKSAAESHALSGLFGGANALSKVVYTDLKNLQRINTTGWHLHALASVRRQGVFGAAVTTDATDGSGSNYNINKAPATVAGAQTLYQTYELPFAYGDDNLTGAVFANVIGQTQNLQVTINPNFYVASTGNAVQGVYKSNGADLGVISAYNINIWMEYIDQLPRLDGGGYDLPLIDLATQYTLIDSVKRVGGVNTQTDIELANYRSYLSLMVGYDNAGTLNDGSDITEMKLVTANSLELFNLNPKMNALLNGRNRIWDDWPAGVHYFSFRDRPINTQSYGVTNLGITPSSVGTNAQFLVGSEYLQRQTQAPAGSAILSNA